MIKYRVSITNQIEKFEVIKETKKYIIFSEKEIKERKSSGYHSWHDTLDDAKKFLVKKYSDKIQSWKDLIRIAEKEIEKINKIYDKV